MFLTISQTIQNDDHPLQTERKHFYYLNSIKTKTSLTLHFSNLTQPEFDWTADTIGVVDSSYFWGYIITQIPGGFLAARLPANRVFGTAIAISAALNILLPGSAYIHPGAFVIIRIFQGFAEVIKI